MKKTNPYKKGPLKQNKGTCQAWDKHRELRPFKTEGPKPPEQSQLQTLAGYSSKIWVCKGTAWDPVVSQQQITGTQLFLCTTAQEFGLLTV